MNLLTTFVVLTLAVACTAAKRCADRNSQGYKVWCPRYADKGYCAKSHKYARWMSINCCGSCKKLTAITTTKGCADIKGATRCQGWADKGYCDKSHKYGRWMEKNCCITCKKGGRNTSGGNAACVDTNVRQCVRYTQSNWCEKNHQYNWYMVKNCCASCKKGKVAESWGAWGACENGKMKRYRLPAKMSWATRSCVAGIKAEGSPQSDAEQRCLDKHNKYRRDHGKKELIWNSRIAASARDWAAKQSQGSGMNMVHSQGTGYGENMAWASAVASETEGEEAVKRWYDEICLYDSCDPPSGGTGHYTQVVWTDSEYVGCAVVTNGGGVYTVAQYYPPGNYKGEYCAKAGTPDEVLTQRREACNTK